MSPKKVENKKAATVKSLELLAVAVGCDRKSLSRWKNEKGFPQFKKGAYDIEAVRAWMDSTGKMTSSGRNSKDEPTDVKELRKRLLEQEVEKNDLDIAVQKKELVSLDEAKELSVRVWAFLARKIKDMPNAMALRCNPNDPTLAKNALKEWVHEAQTDFEEICRNLKQSNS